MIRSRYLALVLLCAFAFAQQQEGPLSGRRRKSPVAVPAVRVQIGLTLVPVTVTDTSGRTILGLTRDRFHVFEDGVEQRVQSLHVEDAPVSVAVVFDASKSMTGKLDRAREAVGQLFRRAAGGDEFLLVEFNDTPRVLSPFTMDTATLQNSLLAITPRNWTALLDAVYLGIHHSVRSKNPRKALFILSDGADNHSRYTESEIKSLVRETDVAIYGLGLTGGGVWQRPDAVLKYLSEQTGGVYRAVEKTSELPEAVSRISAAMHDQYQLGYSSTSMREAGLYRKIEVRVDQPAGAERFRVSWRRGYCPDPQ
ncbi:MAG: VWA domain-containing protein [Acidobacteria bacterium]|nr:VWA domain-containing protein [Acidobacteriota bacterium]